ncbi:uncharacterized protein EAE98_011897 [Botrytis deweyae]|uniref:Uncharacterized protein n=1 Tax=Botrytis deweyae TaxID=2478750 RepID=A0ABQ7I4X9_9HELO|nr:uncharacterized protein EAE98_011897 [Botrytis deweyae]KAF7911782.1 hypothetical protein EAE98_011897 [Botrytis deweyae]
MPNRTFEELTTKPIYQGITPKDGYILRYRHKNYVFNGSIGDRKFVEAANVAFDHADYVAGLRSGKDRVYEDADHFVIARRGVHKTDTYTETGGFNSMADTTEHLTMTAISRNERNKEADRKFGATGHIPTKAVTTQDEKKRTITKYVYNAKHIDPESGVALPWSWFPARKLESMNREALVSCIDILKIERTPSPEQKQKAVPTTPAPIPISPWGAGGVAAGKAKVNPSVEQITKGIAESSVSESKKEGKLPVRNNEENAERSGRTATQGREKSRSRSSSKRATARPKKSSTPSKSSTATNPPPSRSSKSTPQRYDRKGNPKSDGDYVKENGKLIKRS